MVILSETRLEYYYQLPTAILSIISCLFVVVLFLLAKPLRVYAFKLVFWLEFFDLIKFSVYVIPSYDTESLDYTWCSTLALINYFVNYATLTWTLAIACTLYQCLILNIDNVEKYYKFWVVICFTYSITCSVIPLFTHSYGYYWYICGFKSDYLGDIYKICFFYCPLACVIIAITYIYVKIYMKYSTSDSSVNSSEKFLSMKRLLAYPLIISLCMIPSIIVEMLLHWGIENFIISIIVLNIWNLHGLFNAMAYALTRPVVIYLKSFFTEDCLSAEEINLFDTLVNAKRSQLFFSSN